MPPERGAEEAVPWVGLALSALGLVVLVWLVRVRGTGRDPVPRGEPVVDRNGLLALAAGMMAWLAGGLLFGVLKGVVHGTQSLGPSEWGTVEMLSLSTVMYGSAAMAAVVVLRFDSRRRSRAAPAGPAAMGGLWWALAFLPIALAVGLLVDLVHESLDVPTPAQGLVDAALKGPRGEFLAVAGYAVIVAPVVEELLFRRCLFGGLRSLMRPPLAGFLSAVAFSLVHLEPGNVAALPTTFLLGLVTAWLTERTGGLAAPIAMHAGYNGAQVLVMATLR